MLFMQSGYFKELSVELAYKSCSSYLTLVCSYDAFGENLLSQL